MTHPPQGPWGGPPQQPYGPQYPPQYPPQQPHPQQPFPGAPYPQQYPQQHPPQPGQQHPQQHPQQPGQQHPQQPGPFPGLQPSGPPGAVGPWGGYGHVPWAPPAVKRTHHGALLVLLTVCLLVVGGAFVVISRIATPGHTTYVCPPSCGRPPSVTPVASRPLYTGGDGTYTVRYDASQGSLATTTGSDGVTERWSGGDGGIIRLFGQSASGHSATQIAHDVATKAFPDAHRAYEIPNAIVGYHLGYGEIDDVFVQSSDGSESHERLIVMVAVKNGLALVAEALGPYHPVMQGGETDDGHPTGAAVEIGLFLDPLINTFSWRGDPPR